MVTERVRTLPTEPTEGEIAKSNPLLSFINSSQRGRKYYHGLHIIVLCTITPQTQGESRKNMALTKSFGNF